MISEPSRPLRICLVSAYDLALDGGVNKHILYLARALRRRGDDVAILGPASGPLPADPDITGLSGVVSIQGNESDNRIGVRTSPLAVRRYMRARRFDVLHVHEPLVPLLPYYAAWMTRAPARVCTFHAFAEAESSASERSRRAMSFVLRPYQRGIAVSEPAARFARRCWPHPLRILPNGVDTAFLAPPSVAPRAPDGPLKLLFIGQWTDRRKGMNVLLEAVRQLAARPQPVDVVLDVVGQGDRRVPVPSDIPRVTFRGRLSEDGLRAALHGCDVLVAPSTGQESFGIVLTEAMSAGRAIVASDIEGYRQVVTHEGALLVPPGDAWALGEAIATLAADPARRAAMGRHNLQAVKRYDWDAVALGIREEYLGALGDAASRG